MHGFGLVLAHNIDRHLLVAACNAYSIANSKNAKAIYEELKRQGRRAGRKRLAWDVQRARELYAGGKAWRSIAKEVGASYQTVRREFREYPAGAPARSATTTAERVT
jgi:DNA invertase Pin-like site-specific DNA recombinase